MGYIVAKSMIIFFQPELILPVTKMDDITLIFVESDRNANLKSVSYPANKD
jgi:hypothetical protein